MPGRGAAVLVLLSVRAYIKHSGSGLRRGVGSTRKYLFFQAESYAGARHKLAYAALAGASRRARRPNALAPIRMLTPSFINAYI